jgi:3-hydroxyacyl-CoA dehydrogenase
MTTVGFIGSGQIGSAITRLAIAAGHQVMLSNSRGPETLADTAAKLGPAASAATSREAAAAGDIEGSTRTRVRHLTWSRLLYFAAVLSLKCGLVISNWASDLWS